MIQIDLRSIQKWYVKFKQSSLQGRWITLAQIEPVLKKLEAQYKLAEVGTSTLKKPIYKVVIGSGKINVLIWSQMHGNESTGTKALFDLFSFFDNPGEFNGLRDTILKQCTITCVPVLNPDGAEAYTRLNADEIDLNRDVIDQKAPETKVLLKILKEVNPHYCFNLHDQRTIFTVGDTKKSATLSFLAPSEDKQRSITEGRKETMRVIVAINELLQKLIPGHIGRYTDEFYPTATGDNFQKMGHNTILIEAGHAQDDYKREEVRFYNFLALLQGLNYISAQVRLPYEPYFNIPNNTENYLDIIYKGVYLTSKKKKIDVGILFKEVLKNREVLFDPVIEHVGGLKKYEANSIINEKGLIFANENELQRFLKKEVKFLGFI